MQKTKGFTKQDKTIRTRSLGIERPAVYDVFDVGSTAKYMLKILGETLLTNQLFDKFLAAQSDF